MSMPGWVGRKDEAFILGGSPGQLGSPGWTRLPVSPSEPIFLLPGAAAQGQLGCQGFLQARLCISVGWVDKSLPLSDCVSSSIKYRDRKKKI